MNNLISQMQSHLELIKHKIDDLEYWSARELMDVLGYKSWAKFKDVISKSNDSLPNK